MASVLAAADRAFDRVREHPVAIGWAVLALFFTLVTPFGRAIEAQRVTVPFLATAGGAAAWSVAFVVFDALVIRALLDDPPAFRDRLLSLAGWGVLGALIIFAVVAAGALGLGAIAGGGAGLYAFIGVLLVWPILTFHVSPAIVADGRSLRGALCANRRRVRDEPGTTALAGGLLVFVHTALLFALFLATILAIYGLGFFWLVFPILLLVIGLALAIALLLVSPAVYAYTRALKIEAYRETEP